MSLHYIQTIRTDNNDDGDGNGDNNSTKTNYKKNSKWSSQLQLFHVYCQLVSIYQKHNDDSCCFDVTASDTRPATEGATHLVRQLRLHEAGDLVVEHVVQPLLVTVETDVHTSDMRCTPSGVYGWLTRLVYSWKITKFTGWCMGNCVVSSSAVPRNED